MVVWSIFSPHPKPTLDSSIRSGQLQLVLVEEKCLFCHTSNGHFPPDWKWKEEEASQVQVDFYYFPRGGGPAKFLLRGWIGGEIGGLKRFPIVDQSVSAGCEMVVAIKDRLSELKKN